ncbi:N-formylglutamate amidohydrolase [Altericroceibacterium endophyticum]|uniref:N-formylglutamate amidohydrolase n=1 Tax=Altericroceibacterium endophyticum TaxID=1808508 RepID=A0A6I4T7S5_9SPHN|nr:N-formylglutamate amidohydrolase [Altericroceibacterium endophyticum]MXO66043.1 N-formylglutamate amidohydrolase [Altericroceibacterium endophyticum]
MSEPLARQIGSIRKNAIVSVCDHASNRVPEGVDLGLDDSAMQKHIAWDIGAAGVVEEMHRQAGFAAYLAQVSRLVIDLHREEDSPGLMPEVSDGQRVPGNVGADKDYRIKRFHRPYHAGMAAFLDEADPSLILSIHSFTPQMESNGAPRPWEIGLLYNQDDRAARHAIRFFEEAGCVVGDNEPYSGKQFNATMNRHAEAFGRPYCAIEIRNDLIADPAGQAKWAATIADVAARVATALQ